MSGLWDDEKKASESRFESDFASVCATNIHWDQVVYRNENKMSLSSTKQFAAGIDSLLKSKMYSTAAW